MSPRKRQIKLNALMMAKVVRMLFDGGVTVYQIAEETGLGYITTLRYVNALRREGVVRIDSWVRSGSQHVAAYELGDEPDAPKKLKCPRESAAEWRARRAMKNMIQRTAGAA